jgi:exopolysaccharide biosynthesis polyprenyl glycosylphosphotransferase
MSSVGQADALVERIGLPQAPAPPRRTVVQGRYRDRDFILRRTLLVADMLGLWLALALAMTLTGSRDAPLADSLWLLPTLPAWAFLFWTYQLYRRSLRRFGPVQADDVASLFHALVIGALGLWVFYKLAATAPRLNFEEMLVFGLVALPLIASLRATLRTVSLRLRGPERVFAVAPAEDVRLLERKLANHPEYEMSLVGSLSDGLADPSPGPSANGSGARGLEEVEALVAARRIDHLVVRLDASYLPQERLRELMLACHREGIRFGCFPGVKGLLLPGTELNHVEGMGILTADPPVLSRTAKTMKRSLDVVVSALALTLLAPLLALIAIAIRLDSKGPALYRQVRVGKDGRRFELLKFRTMVVGADRLDRELMKRSIDPDWLVMEADPRVTRLGRFLRRSSVDELPQLWNVLRGEMSMVGPRPLSERDDEGVRGWRRHRLDLVPGITGYWQVLGRNDIPFQEMLDIDYAYVASWSLWSDLRLFLRTIPAVIRRRGAN